jgi:hypothetical protein
MMKAGVEDRLRCREVSNLSQALEIGNCSDQNVLAAKDRKDLKGKASNLELQ